ncbi:hypothetical protein GCM10009730_00270 [Streptomyces albidochromogenes]
MPVAASPATASRLGSCPVGPPGPPAAVQSTATVLVNTEAMPNAPPAAVASSTLRTTARRTRRATRKRTATPPAVTSATASRSPPARDCASAVPVSDNRPASPADAMIAPRQAAAPAPRRTNTAAIGSAKTMVSAPSGCTRDSGPYASAPTCSSAPNPLSATAAHHAPWRSGAYGRAGVVAATRSWTMAPAA